MDQTTDFARLADMSDRKRSSSSQNAVEISGLVFVNHKNSKYYLKNYSSVQSLLYC